jgi:hypothetical protein
MGILRNFKAVEGLAINRCPVDRGCNFLGLMKVNVNVAETANQTRENGREVYKMMPTQCH